MEGRNQIIQCEAQKLGHVRSALLQVPSCCVDILSFLFLGHIDVPVCYNGISLMTGTMIMQNFHVIVNVLFLSSVPFCYWTKQKYSAVSLCNISTEVLKVINATEELIAESTGPWEFPPVPPDREKGTFPLGTDQVRLDEQLTSLEENVRQWGCSLSRANRCKEETDKGVTDHEQCKDAYRPPP